MRKVGMKYKKIHIIGGPGSGKTYISKKLSDVYNIPVFDLDSIFWDKKKREYVRTSDDYRSIEIERVLQNSSWVIEGVYYKGLSRSFEKSDLIIVLRTPLYLRQWRIFKRFIFRKLDFNHDKQVTLSRFIEAVIWNHKYDNDNLIRFSDFTAKHAGKIVYCRTYSEIESAINTLQIAPSTESQG